MSLDFEKYAAKGNAIVNLLSRETGTGTDSAARILRATLHGLRNRLSTEDSFHVLAQLPMALKGIYVDGWKPTRPYERIKHVKDFFDDIRKEDGATAGYDFGNDDKMKIMVGCVFRTLKYHISKGEMDNIINCLPADISEMIIEQTSTTGNNI
jgi:uncharacterized protein (DUF2267 family)